jgi:hypothetical protein
MVGALRDCGKHSVILRLDYPGFLPSDCEMTRLSVPLDSFEKCIASAFLPLRAQRERRIAIKYFKPAKRIRCALVKVAFG